MTHNQITSGKVGSGHEFFDDSGKWRISEIAIYFDLIPSYWQKCDRLHWYVTRLDPTFLITLRHATWICFPINCSKGITNLNGYTYVLLFEGHFLDDFELRFIYKPASGQVYNINLFEVYIYVNLIYGTTLNLSWGLYINLFEVYIRIFESII